MLNLDMTTTVAIYVLVNYICTFMIFLTWSQNKEKFQGLSYMLYDFLFQSIGMSLAAMHGLAPTLFTIGFANIFMFSGAILFLFGMAMFLNQSINKRFYLVYTMIFIGAYIYCIYFEPFFRIRALLFNGMIFPVFIHIVYLIFFASNPRDKKHTRATGFTFVLFSILTLFRFYYAFIETSQVQYFNSLKMDNILVVFSILCTLLLTFSLQMMINKKLYYHLERLATTDPLTKVYNRRKTEQAIENEIHNFKRYKHSFCILLADIDHFKQFNDNYGHDVGDKALIHVTSTMKKDIRVCDTMGRWGGEEFILVLPKTSLNEACALSKRLVQSVYENKLSIDNYSAEITISIGVAEFKATSTYDDLIKQADTALYLAKEKGRNRYEVYH